MRICEGFVCRLPANISFRCKCLDLYLRPKLLQYLWLAVAPHWTLLGKRTREKCEKAQVHSNQLLFAPFVSLKIRNYFSKIKNFSEDFFGKEYSVVCTLWMWIVCTFTKYNTIKKFVQILLYSSTSMFVIMNCLFVFVQMTMVYCICSHLLVYLSICEKIFLHICECICVCSGICAFEAGFSAGRASNYTEQWLLLVLPPGHQLG